MGIANLLSQGCFTYGGYEYDLPGNISPDHADLTAETGIRRLETDSKTDRAEKSVFAQAVSKP